MLFDHTLQAAMTLLDGVDKWEIWRQHDHMNQTPVSSNSGGTTMLRCGHAPSKMMKTSSLTSTRGAKMTTNSLIKAWKVALVTNLCSIMW